MINRRGFIKALGAAAAVVLLVSDKALAFVKPKKRFPTIAQIIAIIHPLILDKMRGTNNKFVSDTLNRAVVEGRIKIVSLGAIIEDAETGRVYEVKQCSVPHVWTEKDERNAVTEDDKIKIANNLCESGIHAHDLRLERLLEEHDLVVSKDFRYVVGPIGKLHQLPRNPDWCVQGDKLSSEAQRSYKVCAHYFQLYTAYAALPKGTLTRGNNV